MLSARGPARRTARPGRPERRARGRHCGRQDREPAAVGLRSVPLGGLGGGVFTDGDRSRERAESGAGAGGELSGVSCGHQKTPGWAPCDAQPGCERDCEPPLAGGVADQAGSVSLAGRGSARRFGHRIIPPLRHRLPAGSQRREAGSRAPASPGSLRLVAENEAGVRPVGEVLPAAVAAVGRDQTDASRVGGDVDGESPRG